MMELEGTIVPMVDMIKEEIVDDMLPQVDDNAIAGEFNSQTPDGRDNHFTKENNDLFNTQSTNGVNTESSINIAECSSNPLDSPMEENPLTTQEKPATKQHYKRKLPKKKPRRKLFTRRKNDAKKRKEIAMLTPEVILKEQLSLMESEDYNPDMNETGEEQNKETSASSTLTHTSVTVVKQEPNCTSDDTLTLSAVFQGPTVRVQKVLLHRQTKRGSGVTVFTPAPASEDTVLTNPIQYPGSKPKPRLMEPASDNSTETGNIPTATNVGSKATVALVAQPGKTPRFTLVARPENIPKTSFIANTSTVTQPGYTSATTNPGTIPKASFVAPCKITPKFALISQPGKSPRITFVNQPVNNQEACSKAKAGAAGVAQSGNCPRLSAVASQLNPERSARESSPQPGNIPSATPVTIAGNVPVVSPSTQCENVPSASSVAQPGSFPSFSSVAQPGIVLGVSQATRGNLPTTSLTHAIAQKNLTNSFVRPFTGNLKDHRKELTKEELLIQKVGEKLLPTIPSPWVTVLRPRGVALGLLSVGDIVTIRRSIFFEDSGKVVVAVHGKELPEGHVFWEYVKEKTVPLREDNVDEFIANVQRLFLRLRGMEMCRAIVEYQQFWKCVDNVELDDNRFQELRTGEGCRAKNCQLLVPTLRNKRCAECSRLFSNMSRRNSEASKKTDDTLSIHKPFKYMTSPEKKERFIRAVREIRRLKTANKRLTEKLDALLEEGVPLDSLPDNDETEMADDNSENEF